MNTVYSEVVKETISTKAEGRKIENGFFIFDFFDLCPKCCFLNTVYSFLEVTGCLMYLILKIDGMDNNKQLIIANLE